MVADDAEVIAQILKVKSQMDSGMFKPLQLAAVQALSRGPEWFRELNDEYRLRKVLAGEIFDMLGVTYDMNSSGMFLWGKVPMPDNSGDPRLREAHAPPSRGWHVTSVIQASEQEESVGQRLSDKILYEAGVFITPGFIFGKNGEDYVRISLCAKPQVLKRAADKIRSVILNEAKDL